MQWLHHICKCGSNTRQAYRGPKNTKSCDCLSSPQDFVDHFASFLCILSPSYTERPIPHSIHRAEVFAPGFLDYLAPGPKLPLSDIPDEQHT